MKSIRSYLVFDFETTGLEPERDRIIQVGLCTVVDGEARDRQSWLVHQDARIDPEATHVHGITADDLRAKGISPQESLTKLCEAMQSAPACLGHNIHRFDLKFMRAEARRLGMVPPDARDFIDTAALFKG